jgi:hypothetical protein
MFFSLDQSYTIDRAHAPHICTNFPARFPPNSRIMMLAASDFIVFRASSRLVFLFIAVAHAH